MNESRRLWSRARFILVGAGAVASGLALWLTLWLPSAQLHAEPWPTVAWVVLLLLPALGVLTLAVQQRDLLLRTLGVLRVLSFWMFAGALITLTYNIGLFLAYVLVIAYSLAGLEVLGGVRRVRAADAAAWGDGLFEASPAPRGRPDARLGDTAVTPYLGAYREPSPGEIKPAREMFPHATTGPGPQGVLTYLYDAGDAGVRIPEATVQEDRGTTPRLRRRARWWVLGAALFANVVAALSAWVFVPLLVFEGVARTDPDWRYFHLPLGGALLVVPYLLTPFVAFFVGMSAATPGQDGSRSLARYIGVAMAIIGAVCLVTGPTAGPVPLLTVAYLLAALAYLYGIRLCRRADEAPGW